MVFATACGQATAAYGDDVVGWPTTTTPLNFCDIPCVQELMDCHDDQRMENIDLDADDVAAVVALCGATDPCGEITEQMLPVMNMVCCATLGNCNEVGLPTTCSQDCADI